MLVLHELPELDAFLIRLLATDTIMKTGVGVTEDIAQLARSYPAMQVMSAIHMACEMVLREFSSPYNKDGWLLVSRALPFPLKDTEGH